MIPKPHEPCGYCGAPKVKLAFAPGGGKKARIQHPHKFKCVNGHVQWMKRR